MPRTPAMNDGRTQRLIWNACSVVMARRIGTHRANSRSASKPTPSALSRLATAEDLARTSAPSETFAPAPIKCNRRGYTIRSVTDERPRRALVTDDPFRIPGGAAPVPAHCAQREPHVEHRRQGVSFDRRRRCSPVEGIPRRIGSHDSKRGAPPASCGSTMTGYGWTSRRPTRLHSIWRRRFMVGQRLHRRRARPSRDTGSSG